MATYLRETHQPIKGPVLDHELLDVGQALVEIPVLSKILFPTMVKKKKGLVHRKKSP